MYGCPGSNGGNTTGCNDTSKTPTSEYFLRYNCGAQILYVLVLAIPSNVINTSGDQYVKNGTTILVDKTSGNNGTPPDFQYIVSGSNTTGWEASIGGLAPGNYTLRFEAHVTGNNTSGTGPGGTSVILDPCNPTAVTVN